MKNNSSSQLNLLAVLLTVGMVIISWQIISPSYHANTQKINALDSEITNAQAKLDSLDEARKGLSSIDSAYNIISVAVPDNTDEPNLITELEAIATKHNIVLPSISISAGSSANSEETVIQAGSPITISISVSGKFDQLNDFITDLEKSVKFFNIKNMNYAYGEDGILSLSLSIQAHSRSTNTALLETTY